jgi:hypothetical protein
MYKIVRVAVMGRDVKARSNRHVVINGTNNIL